MREEEGREGKEEEWGGITPEEQSFVAWRERMSLFLISVSVAVAVLHCCAAGMLHGGEEPPLPPSTVHPGPPGF